MATDLALDSESSQFGGWGWVGWDPHRMSFSSNTHTDTGTCKHTDKDFLAQLSWPLPLELFMVLLGRMIAASFESWDLFVTSQYFCLICIRFVSYARLSSSSASGSLPW